ncbi:MAG: nitrite reductase large subunit, partial [Planctomycetes bacterium]|nr:nitrite reductase large subunit [Planctomycetota bacterium]
MDERNLVVVGNGMVGHKLLASLVERGLGGWRVTVIGEEPRLAYDRVNLSAFFAGTSAEQLSLLPSPGFYQANGIRVIRGDKVAAIDRAARTVRTAAGIELAYDRLVLATGSFPFVPPVPNKEAPGCFVYRTLCDLDSIRSYATGRKVGVVIGGGLLGLEAANALKSLGLTTHVVEFAPRLMGVQVDDGGGAILKRKIEKLGVGVHLGKSTKEIALHADGSVAGLKFADGGELKADLVVFSAGIRPRDELAKACGLTMGERGAVVIDEQCRTSDPEVSAIGEVALYKNRIYGLVAPGYHMARVVADDLLGAESGKAAQTFTGFDMSTKLKLLGVEVGSFGDAFAATPGAVVVNYADSATEVYKKLVLSPDRKRLLGGILVGDTASYGQLHQAMQNALPMPDAPEDLILPARSGAKPTGFGAKSLPESATICSCHNVSKGSICGSIREQKLDSVGQIKSCTKAGTGCGSCVTILKDLLKDELEKSGVKVLNHVCEHFAHSRQELYSLVRFGRIRSYDDLIAKHGRGAGCEICKPVVASILASAWNEHVLERKHAVLQDTNDRFLANIQRDGSYSVVPRVPAGEITPDQLIALGVVAKKFKLYTKITGGQRVDLFGASVDQLPLIWRELIDAGFESGHAYGKALRTVKSCVGSTWCRYGVQDSVGLAITIENRYKGLRSPHKLKSAVSGCARECAEAQSKDFGVIATENGY